VLVVGGSRGLTGAPSLSARAAMRADAGYVTVAAPSSTLPVLERRLLEAVKRPLPDDGDGVVAAGAADIVLALAERASALAIGPGLGRGAGPRELVRRVLAEVQLPVVVDADALFELEPAAWAGPRVLTPHEGELARLLGRESKEVAAHRLASVQEAAEKFRAVVVLKGEDSLVAAPGRGVLVCALGLPSLSTAGTGDVLTGITAAFLAKGMEPRRAAAAACAHAGISFCHQRDGRRTFEDGLSETIRNPSCASGGVHVASCSRVAPREVSSFAHSRQMATWALIARRSFGAHSS